MVDQDPINLDIKSLKESSEEVKNIRTNFNQVGKVLDEINETLRDYNSLTGDLNEALKQQTKEVKDINVEYLKYYELKQKVSKAEDNIVKFQDKYKSSLNKINEKLKVQQVIEEGMSARRDLGEYISKSIKAQQELNQAINDGSSSQLLINTLRDKAIDAAKLLVKKEEAYLKLSQALTGNWDDLNINLSEAEKSYAAQAIQQRLAQERAKDIVRNNKNQLEILNQQTSKWQKITSAAVFYDKKIKGVNTEFNKILSNIEKISGINLGFSAIIGLLLDYDKLLTNSAKQLGISKDGARELANSYDDTSYYATEYNKNANAALITIRSQFEAQSQLNDALGTAGLFTAKSRIDQTVLTKQMGLSAQEAANLYKLGSLNQKSAEETSKIIAQEVINSGKQNRNKLDYKKILQDVSKVEGQLAAQYQNNPELIAKAVAQTKQLGLELQQVVKISDSLLSFQSSIQNELEAELLIGKALNFERARELALRGDSVGAAKELVDQVGSLEEFQQLNVLQQKSLAQAIGLSADELANSLKQQQLLANTGFESQQAFEEAARNANTQAEKEALRARLLQSTNADQLMAQAQQISNQEKIAEAANKLKDALAEALDGPLGGIIDGFANLVSNATTLKTVFYSIAVLMTGKLLLGAASLVAEIAAMAAGAVATGIGLTAGLGAVAIVAGIIGAIAAINSATGQNISVNQATGGGINNNALSSVGNNNTSQNNKPINLNSNVVVNLGGNTIANVNTTAQKSTNSNVA